MKFSKRESNASKFAIQDSQYEFPYHHIPHFEEDGTVSLIRKLSWGLEYLCYQKHLHEKVLKMNPASVLEVGCGDGFFVGSLPDSIATRIGIDLSERAVAYAKGFHPGCDFRVQDILTMQEKFDVVAAIEVVEHIPDSDLPSFFCALSQKVSDNGKVMISVPTTVIPLKKKHYRHYTIELLKKQILDADCGLQIVEHEYLYRTPWWFSSFRRFFNNRFFTLEVKPFMRFAWMRVWKKYRFAECHNGRHLVVILDRVRGC